MDLIIHASQQLLHVHGALNLSIQMDASIVFLNVIVDTGVTLNLVNANHALEDANLAQADQNLTAFAKPVGVHI